MNVSAHCRNVSLFGCSSFLALGGDGENRGVFLVHCAEAVFAVSLVEHACGELVFILQVLLHFALVVVELDLLEDQFFVFWSFQTKQLEVEVEGADFLADGFILDAVQICHVRVSQGLLHSDTLLRVEDKHLLEQVNGVGVRILKQFVEVLAFARGKLLHEFFVVLVFYHLDEVRAWVSDQISYHVHQVLLVLRG
jgi:hypothetical protein